MLFLPCCYSLKRFRQKCRLEHRPVSVEGSPDPILPNGNPMETLVNPGGASLSHRVASGSCSDIRKSHGLLYVVIWWRKGGPKSASVGLYDLYDLHGATPNVSRWFSWPKRRSWSWDCAHMSHKGALHGWGFEKACPFVDWLGSVK